MYLRHSIIIPRYSKEFYGDVSRENLGSVIAHFSITLCRSLDTDYYDYAGLAYVKIGDTLKFDNML